MPKLGLYTGYERRSILVFLFMLLILFCFWTFLNLPKRNAVALRKREATQPVKSYSERAGILQADPQIVASSSINFATAKNLMARSYQDVAKMAGCLAAFPAAAQRSQEFAPRLNEEGV